MAKDYDVILLAPQVSFRLSEVEGVLKNKRVYALSPALFGKYDVGNTITFLEDELYKEKEVQSQQENPLPIKQMLKAHQQVLALAFIQLDQKVRLVSRLYDENNMILEDFEVYKNTISVDDIVDLINTILYGYPDIELISLSLPGVVYNGVVTLKKYGLNECHLQAFLEEKYSQKIVINNDVNTIVMGYFASQDDYESVSFLYQARIGGTGGVGHIHRGHLIKGRHNIAGEIQYLPISFSENYQEIKKTPEGALEWTMKYCLGITSMVAPDAIIIYNRLISKSDDVKKEMEKLEKNLGGIKDMEQLPGVMFIVDPKKERIGILEAKKLGIPVIGLIDTNCNPEDVDYAIPGNDDAIRAVSLIADCMANAVIEGRQGESMEMEAEEEMTETSEDQSMEEVVAESEETTTEE